MSTITTAQIKNYLLESTLEEIREIEKMDYSHIEATDTFKERIKNTVLGKNNKRTRFTPKKVLLIFVAAILVSLSIMFAVSAEIRQAVADFFIDMHETFTNLFIIKENELDNSLLEDEPPEPKYPSRIEVEYKPSYIEENGYTQIDQTKSKLHIFTVWTNGNVIIDMEQSIISSREMHIDTEDTTLETVYIGEQKVYYVHKAGVYYFYWIGSEYVFSLSCDDILGWEEIEKLVLSIKPIN